MVRFLPLLLVVIAFPAAAQVEQRCTELGANCACSETLDTTSYTTSNNGAFINPGNSTTKQCGNNGAFILSGTNAATSYLAFQDETGMPAGNTVSKVWRFAWPNNTVGHGADAYGSITSATRRMCNRFYYKLSSDFNGWTSCNDKYMDITYGASTCEMQIADLNRVTLTNYPCFSNPVDGQNIYPASGGVTRADCMNNWCRIEQCVAGNVQAGTGLTSSFSITQVGVANPKSYSSGPLNVGNAPGAINQEIRAMMLYREPFAGSCTGSRSFSHFMQGVWNTDSAQTIGPAYEIEGGAAPPTGGTSTPTPPAPPVLLP